MKASGLFLRKKVSTLQNKAFYLIVIALLMASAVDTRAQSKSSPDRGAKLGNAYAVGDFETINTVNGNLTIRFPLGGLPAGRGSASAGMYLTYNSKLYNMRSERLPDPRTSNGEYNRAVIEPDLQKGGWQLSSGYRLEFETRFGTYEPPCTFNPSDANDQIAYSNKLFVVSPDGSRHEMIPYGYKDKLNDRYFNVTIDGIVRTCQGLTTAANRPVYYSRDGSFLRLESTSQSNWTLYFSDGSKVVGGTRIYDRNGNYVDMGQGSLGHDITDQFGRTVTVTADTNGDDLVTSKGFEGEDVVWRIKWKQIAVYKTYRACAGNPDCPGADFPLPNYRDVLLASFRVVDEIVQPAQLGGGSYKFTYNGASANPLPTSETDGWGELSGVELPSGAEISYEYQMDGEDGPVMFDDTKDILKNHVVTKTLKYDLEYDGQVVTDGAVETWSYDIGWDESTVTTPDGGVTQTFFGSTLPDSSGGLLWDTGLTLASVSPDGTKVENIWERNIPTDCTSTSTCALSVHQDNPYIKTTFTSLKDSGGSYTLTAAKDFTYDKNGNVKEVREYDFMPSSSVPRTNGRPTALPSNADNYLKRVTKTEFYNAAPDASSTNYSDQNIYIFAVNTKLLNLAKSVEVRDASDNPKSRSEMIYDYTAYASNTLAGNLTRNDTWDSTKGGYSNPLTTGQNGNAVSTTVQYNSYGMPTLTTDAKGNQTQITYGSISTPSGNITNLYPTQTIQAYGTSIQRTSAAQYDFYSGLVTLATDVDNNVSTATEYDDLGRPTKIASAVGNALEAWTQTTYDDQYRKVIVKSDLATKGDAKKVATQFYDQLGRVRLTKTLEDASTQSATNETDGVKVQTRYKITSGYTYQLTSNPYRADTSGNAGSEPTMGWTRSKADAGGKHSEVETFSTSSSANLPAPWGTNSLSTGKVQTDIDADRALVTDQAGKQRISRTNVFGQLEDVWEIIPASDSQSVSVSFPGHSSIAHGYKTSYQYDLLNNLTQVRQPIGSTGGQTRSFTYSTLSRLLSATNPESGTISYVYDNNGNLTEKTDARTIKTNYVYDALNRITNRNYDDSTPDVVYTYNNVTGRLTKVENDKSKTEYTEFDILGRVKKSKQTTDANIAEMEYTYNLSGALIEQKYPSGRVVKNALDNNGDLEMVKSKKSGSGVFWNYARNFAYTAAGAVSSIELGNLRWESTTFNSRLQPTQIALGTTQNTTNVLDLGYSYGTTQNNGNVQSQTINVPAVGNDPGFSAIQTYTYDSLNRIKDATENLTPTGGSSVQTWKQTFSYDRFGNRNFDEANTTADPVSFPKSCGTTPNFTMCAVDRKVFNPEVLPDDNRFKLDQDTDSTDDYLYDAGGNITRAVAKTPSGIELRKFTYDAENKQKKVETINSSGTVTSTLSEYFYDGDGKRVKKVVLLTGETTIFIYDASGKLVEEYSSIVETNNPKVSYLTSDHLGSPRITTDRDGQTISRRDFQPFGEEITTIQRIQSLGYTGDTIRQKFTAYERDIETDLDYAKARYYKPIHGRFTTTDPLLASGKAVAPQSWNRFAYVMNNPLKYIDPTGLCSAPAGLKPGQVGICMEAFIASKTVGGIGKGDNRGFNGENGSLTARVMVQAIISTDTEKIYANWETTIRPSEVRIETNLTENGRIDLPDGSKYSSNVGFGMSEQGTADTNVEFSNVGKMRGEKDFGAGVDVTVSIANGKNGFQVNRLTSFASPSGTIDGSATLRISGSGQVTGVSAQGRPFPSYAVYSYTVGADGKTIQTKVLVEQRETPPVSNLKKPVQPFKINQ